MPAPPNRRVLFAASLPLLALAGLALTCARRPDPAEPRTPAELAARLRDRGLPYECRYVGPAGPGEPWRNPGHYLRRKGDKRPWEELAANPAHAPQSMKGFVLVLSQEHFGGEGAGSPDSGRVVAGRFVLVGDPAELRRIADALP